MKQALEEVGRLAGLRLYQNEEATRKQMKSAITEWLLVGLPPPATRCSYSSRATARQIPNNGSKEKDRQGRGPDDHRRPGLPGLQRDVQARQGREAPPGWARCYNEQKPGADIDVWRRTRQESGGAGAEPESIMKACEQTEGFLLRATAVDDDGVGTGSRSSTAAGSSSSSTPACRAA